MGVKRNKTNASLLYKNAIGLYWALGNLTTKIVSLLHHANNVMESVDNQINPRETLRDAILMCRDQVGQYPHRDQWEILLFATNVLLELGNKQNRFQRQEDADLLFSFCRIALNPYQIEDGRMATESTAYRRSYYDAVMRTKLAIPTLGQEPFRVSQST